MKLYGKAKETAKSIVKAFGEPDALPKAIAPIFIRRNDDSPCRKWSFRNQVLTALAGTMDARGFKQWQKVERKVKKGSKAFYILAPCMAKKEINGETVAFPIGFRGTPVFRLEDTEGKELPGEAEAQVFLDGLPLLRVARSWGLKVQSYNGETSNALGYYRANQAIALGVENLSTWLHELMHAADHKLGKLVERGQHWRSETVAEFGGATLAHLIGEADSADLGGAYSYIEKYAETAKITPVKACMDTLDRVCNSIALILKTADELAAVATT